MVYCHCGRSSVASVVYRNPFIQCAVTSKEKNLPNPYVLTSHHRHRAILTCLDTAQLLHARSYTDIAVVSRLLRRSSRVRSLEYDFMTAAECELAIDVMRAMRGPIAILLPSLQVLQLFPDYVGDVYCMLASNTLLALEILARKTPPSTFDQERLHASLRALQERSPSLRKVTFQKTLELHVSFDQKKLVETLSGFSRLKDIFTDYHLPPQATSGWPLLHSTGSAACPQPRYGSVA